MTQAYLKGSAGRKSMEEGRKSDTGGAHGGPEDEGPCRYPRDDHNKAQPSTINCHNPFRVLTSLFAAIVREVSEVQAAAKRRDESRFSTQAYLKGRAVREADFIHGCKNCLEQPGGYLSQAEFNCLQRSERFMIDYCGGPTTGTFSDALMVVNSPFGDVYVENAGPSLTPACTGSVIVNATCTTCRSEANLVPAIKTDPDSQTAKVDRGGFHFGVKPFGNPTTVGGKGLIAETELKIEVVAAKATVANSVAAIAMASTTCVANRVGCGFHSMIEVQSASCAIGSSRNTVATAAEEATVADGDHLPPDDGDEDEGVDGEEQRLPTAAELRQVSDLLCNSDYQQEKAEKEREAQRIAEDTLMRQAGMLAAAAETKGKGVQPADDMNIDEVSPTALQLASESVMNGEFKSSAVAAQASVGEAKFDAEAPAEALVADATEALSVKVGTASAEAAINASLVEPLLQQAGDTDNKAANWTSSEPSKASKVIIVEVNELAYPAFVKAEVNEFESPSTALTKGLTEVLVSTSPSQVLTSLKKYFKKSCQKPINFLESKVSSFQNSMNFKRSYKNTQNTINSLETKISSFGKQISLQRSNDDWPLQSDIRGQYRGSHNADMREEYAEKEESKLAKSSLSGDLSDDSITVMVVNRPLMTFMPLDWRMRGHRLRLSEVVLHWQRTQQLLKPTLLLIRLFATATPATVNAPKAKFKATSTEPHSVNTAFDDKAATDGEAKFKAEAIAEDTTAAETTVASYMTFVAGVVVVVNSRQQTMTSFHFGDKPSGIPTTVGGKGFIAESESTPSANQVTGWASVDGAEPVEFAFKLASPLNAIAEATAADDEFKSSVVAAQASVDEAKFDAEATAEALVADATEALSVKVADVEVALGAVAAEAEFKSVGTVVTVDATEAKFKATSTAESLLVNTAVADKVGTCTGVGAGTKFDDSIPEANQVNCDVAAAEVNLKTEAKFITADNPEAELMDSTTVQQPTSDTDSAASKAAVVVATAIAEAMWQVTGTNSIVTRSLCNAHPVRAAVAIVDVKFENDGASGADVEVALEAVAAEAEFVDATEAKLKATNTAESLSVNTVGINNTAAAEVVVEAVEVTVAEATAAKATGAKVAAAEAAIAENKCGGVQLADDLNVDEVQAIALSIVVSASDAVKAESSRGPQVAKGGEVSVEVSVVAEVDQATVATDKYKAEVTVETHFEAAAALDPADWKIDGVTKAIEAELKAEALSVKAANGSTEVDRATGANDKYKAEVAVETHFEAAAALDPADWKIDGVTNAIEAELKAEVLSVKAATGSTEVKLKTEADAIKAIEDNSVADKASATAAVVTTDAPEVKFKTTSTDEPLAVNTAFADTAQAPEAEFEEMATTAERAGFAGKAGAGAKATDAEAVDAKAAKVGAAEVGAAECAPERVKVRNVTPERHPSQDLAIMNPVDPQQQQISDNKADCESWSHSWQAPLSNAGITSSDTPPEQPSVDVAVDTTKAVFCLSNSFAGHTITQANSVGGVFDAMNEVQPVSKLSELKAAKFEAEAIVDASLLSNHMISQANSDCVFKAMTEVKSTSCAAGNATCTARKADAIDTVATTNAESAAEDGNTLVGIPTSNGGNNAHGTRPSVIQLQTAKAATQVTVASLFSIPKGKVGTEWKVLTRKDATTLMRGAAAECNKGAAAEHNSISGTIALLLHIPPETVESIIGRWSSYTSIGYQRYKAELMGGIASKLINTH